MTTNTHRNDVKTGTIRVNGADIYHEVRGSGPSILFISADAFDAGSFEGVARDLANEFTVITYDRRGYSRSPRPEAWTATSPQEQADDAAALLEALDLAPAAVFGTSGGAIILLDLVTRRPDVLRGALVHEPPIVGVLPNADEVGAQLQAMVQKGFARGGPRGAIELFARSFSGDVVFDRMEPALRERLLANAEVFFEMVLQPFTSYVSDAEALASAHVLVIPLAGVESRGMFFYDTTRWLAERVGAELVEIPGQHGGYMDHPKEVADILRPILRKLS
jgi:pimeloyl-ACP methyl ester carboxylesterase